MMKKSILPLVLPAVLAALFATAPVQAAPAAAAPACVGMANPFITCSSLDELRQSSDFPLRSPQLLPVNYTEDHFALLRSKEMVQIFYRKGQEEILYRMGNATKADISGDYTEYPMQQTIVVNGSEVLAKGDGTIVRVAVWSDESNSYSLFFSEGIAPEGLTDIIRNIK